MLRRVSPACGNVLPVMLLLSGLVTIATGQTTFTSPTFIPTSNTTTAVASGDFNEDGLPDLVVTDAQTNTAVVLFQSAGGHFTPGTTMATGKGP
ncbi:MAG TPA: VCBS repeat-containing protein, partial [Verrucomicrobiae bacterium]|nr:VCBS repeat-containing protein [Verrucomicrobiae bacterium]